MKSIYLIWLFIFIVDASYARMPSSGFFRAGFTFYEERSSGRQKTKEFDGSTFKWVYNSSNQYIQLWANVTSINLNIKGYYVSLATVVQTDDGYDAYQFIDDNGISFSFFVNPKTDEVEFMGMGLTYILITFMPG